PGETMRGLARSPTFWAPLLAFVALGAAFNAVWLRAIDPAEFARAQIEDSPLAERLSSQDRAEGIAQQARVFPLRSWLGPLVFSPWMLALLSLGFAAAVGLRAGRAAIGVVAVWALYVLGKAALAAVF